MTNSGALTASAYGNLTLTSHQNLSTERGAIGPPGTDVRERAVLASNTEHELVRCRNTAALTDVKVITTNSRCATRTNAWTHTVGRRSMISETINASS